jgi:formyl-CoA transferase
VSDEINGVVAEWTMTLTADEVVERCVVADVPVATAFTAADLFADPHVAARGDLVTVDDPVAGPLRQQAPYPRRVGEVPDPPSGAPTLGQHTTEVLTDLGLDEAELARLAESGVI